MSLYFASPPLTFYLLFYTSLITSIFEVMSARLPDIYWNSTNPIFRIDNTDHIIDVNRAYEYDQINIYCPRYSEDTREEDTETYIIYNVSKEEYDSCQIGNVATSKTIAVCNKPYLKRYYTITFRPFTPQPGGLEFHSGQDYYFISLSTKSGDPNQCQKYHMKVVFKVCCKQQPTAQRPNVGTKIGTSSSIVPAVSSSTIVPPIVAMQSSTPSSSVPSSTSFSFVEFVPGQQGGQNIGVATYKGVISGNQNSTMFPMIINRHHHHQPKPTRSSSVINNNPMANSQQQQQQSKKFGHRFYPGDPRGGSAGISSGSHRYNLPPPQQQQPSQHHYPSLFSTERPSSHGSQINPTRIPHVPYHPYHPRLLTSTPRPAGWRPHLQPNSDHNPPIRLSDHGYKGAYRPNDVREKSDGLNSGAMQIDRNQMNSLCILYLLLTITWTFYWSRLR